MRFALVAFVGVLAAATLATYASYGSLHPCVWLERDQIETSSLTPFLVRAKIKAIFTVNGVLNPGPGDCLLKWWEWRGEALPEEG